MSDNVNEERLAENALKLHRQRTRRVLYVLAGCVAVPTILAVAFYGFLASSRYTSVTKITAGTDGAVKRGITSSGSGIERDIEVARARIQSRAMLDALIKDHGWREHYQGGQFDWVSRLAADAGSEKTLSYYGERVQVKLESKYSLSVSVEAFSPEKAKALGDAIVKATSDHLATQSQKTRDAAMAGAREEAKDAEDKLLAAGKSGASDLEMEVARTRVASAMRALEMAELEATRQVRRLEVIAEPSLPTEASGPRRLWKITTVFVSALALSAMVLLLGGFVREHAKF